MTLEKEIAAIIKRGDWMLERIFDSSTVFGRFAKHFTGSPISGGVTFTIIRKYGIVPDKYCVRIDRECETPTYEGTELRHVTATLMCENKEDYQKIKQYVDSNNAEKVIDTITKKIFDGKGLVLPPLENICIKKWDSLLTSLCTVQEFEVK